ncbi:MAG TPA: 5-formyltetrahydrofolate cyclo-ligase [Patescibacteria group bacterium]|nr:5-formyltetrahydrofolate cyclo-ligase [Patescibacteria group bacterium]
MSYDDIRRDVWEALRKVAVPDSRFHFNFGEFIPDFQGSERALGRLLSEHSYLEAKFIFIAPDNCLERLRAIALSEGKALIVPTYSIKRGFVYLDPKTIPSGKEEYAALLDAMEGVGQHVSLKEIQDLGPVDLMVSGASVVNREGVRLGKGHGFFDLEWAMFYAIGAANLETPVVAFVHSCQVVDMPINSSPYDTVCDIIVTNKETIRVSSPQKPTCGVIWERLNPELFQTIPPLQELKSMQEKGGEA